MHYAASSDDQGLPFNPFKSCTVPRPIGWLSSIGENGVCNLAPYSQWQNLTFDPPLVMFAANQTHDGRRTDTVVNADVDAQGHCRHRDQDAARTITSETHDPCPPHPARPRDDRGADRRHRRESLVDRARSGLGLRRGARDPARVAGGQEIRTRKFALGRSRSNLGMRVDSQPGGATVGAVSAAGAAR